MHWKLLDRKVLLDSKFLKVYEDKVELPNGTIIPDYSVIEKPSYTIIVATDTAGNIISLQEYKYAIDQTINALPAGHVEKDEDILESAKRELLEETGYQSNDVTLIGEFYDYPSKDSHKAFFVRIKNAKDTGATHHENTESIKVRLISLSQLQEEIQSGEWSANSSLAALLASGIFFS